MGGTLGVRERAGFVAKMGKARLKVERKRVIDFGANAVGSQVLAQAIPPGSANDELVVDMPGHVERNHELGWNSGRASEKRTVAVGIRPTGRGPFGKLAELHAQDGGLKRVQTKVSANEVMNVFRLASVGAQNRDLVSESVVVGEQGTAIAHSA